MFQMGGGEQMNSALGRGDKWPFKNTKKLPLSYSLVLNSVWQWETRRMTWHPKPSCKVQGASVQHPHPSQSPTQWETEDQQCFLAFNSALSTFSHLSQRFIDPLVIAHLHIWGCCKKLFFITTSQKQTWPHRFCFSWRELSVIRSTTQLKKVRNDKQ